MTDDLRTRIAAVQQAHHIRIDPNHPAYGYCMCGFNPDADEDDFWWVAHAKHVADAVIAELERPKRPPQVYYPARIHVYEHIDTGYCYPADYWKADDE